MGDNNRINNIEYGLKNNPSNVSTNDLIYYLQVNSNNQQLDPNNLSNTQNYLTKINNSFFYENVFVNTGNYSMIVTSVIGLLIPFYYFYPRFYNIGFWGIAIGFMSLLSLYSITNSLFSNFFIHTTKVFIALTCVIYLIFFILLNKLNHISLFFISAVISFVIINYIFRIILTLPTSNNPYSQYSATMNNNTQYTQYNVLIETTCFQIIDRFNLKLPSGNMLYSYLTVFQIGDNTNKITNFLTNLLSPLISVFILYLLGTFLSKVEYNNILNNSSVLKLFPIIGFNEEGKNLFNCQANYILPKELNVDLLIHGILDKYDFDDKIYKKIQKAFIRISNELLEKYNPKFMILDNLDKHIILQNLKDNKIFQSINKILKKNAFEFNLDYITEMKNLIDNEKIDYKEKEKMFDLLKQIDNTLLVINDVNQKYNNNSILARNELLYDKEIKEEYKNLLGNLTNEYIKNFTDNLNLKGGLLFGYDYNIITYSWLSQNIRLKSNKVFRFILKFISVWMLFTKPIGTPWLFVRYIMTENFGFKSFLETLCGNSIIWKYFSTGLDKSSLEEMFKNIKNNEDTSIIKEGFNLLYSFIIFIFALPIFYMFNSINFGLSLSPSWYNILYQIVFIINILGNLHCYYKKGSYLLYNIKFIIAFIIIFIFISIISYAINNYNNN